jgi:predicted dehydrogenase
VPEGLDWDTWLGQAPFTDYVPERCHRTFRYFLEYSGGTITDWGAHHVDIALWGLGLDRSGPVTVEGRRLVEPIPGGFTAPSEYEIHYTYASPSKVKTDGSLSPAATLRQAGPRSSASR